MTRPGQGRQRVSSAFHRRFVGLEARIPAPAWKAAFNYSFRAARRLRILAISFSTIRSAANVEMFITAAISA